MFKRELKINLKSFIVWTAIMLFFFVLVFIMYPTIITNGDVDINEMLKMFPEELLKMFNMDVFGIDTALGWIQTEGYTIWLLLGGVYAALLGSAILTKEENDGTIEFFIAKPIKRRTILLNKYLAGALYIVLFNVVIYITCIIGLCFFFNESFKLITVLGLAPILVHISIYSLSFAISTFFKKTNQTRGIALAITFGFYILQIIGNMSNDLTFLKDISLFEFASSRYLTLNLMIKPVYLIVGILIILISLATSYYVYENKELV